MKISRLFKKKESLLAVDIGSSVLKVIELDILGAKPRVLSVGVVEMPPDIFTNNIIAKPDLVAEYLTNLLDENDIADRRVAIAVPASSVFTKRIKMPRATGTELGAAVHLEAGNFIPHNIDAVRLDFQILGGFGRNQLDVLVVAVKNEIVDSFVDAIASSGLETALVDVDFFALQNMFEINYPELNSQTVAIINVGTRYSSIVICRKGEALFTGDISVGGKLYTDALVEGLGIKPDEAEKIKRQGFSKERHAKVTAAGHDPKALEGVMGEAIGAIAKQIVEQMASEFNRQLSFFWNASGSDEGIDKIMLCGGGALVPGLCEGLSEKTGIPCELLNPFKEVEHTDEIDQAQLDALSPLMGVAVGLGIRSVGDKPVPDLE